MSAIRFTLHAGPHARVDAPVTVTLPAAHTAGSLTIDGQAAPCQCDGDQLSFVLAALDAGATADCVFTPAPGSDAMPPTVTFADAGDAVDIHIDGKPLTTYRYRNNGGPRPYFFPLLGPGGIPVTRAFPMEKVDGETADHPHHRSLWVAHGDINGADHWSEMDGHATQQHQSLDTVTSGAAFGRLTATNLWLDHQGNPQLTETRTFTAHAVAGDRRIMDLDITFAATHGNVRFGDTKEGGLCAVRVATSMDGKADGLIETAINGIGEAESWGRPAHWVDYHGPCGNAHLGIAIFDHPMNLRHPTPWHVRNYGLFAANPFAHSYYKQSHLTDGTYDLPAGESLTFRYRLLLHTGDTAAANVGDHYHNYANPPYATA